MQIGIDVSRIIEGNIGGVNVYTYNLINALAKIDQKNKYLLYPYFWECFPVRKYNKNIFPQQKNFSIHCQKIPLSFIRNLWYSKIFPKEFLLNIKKIDLIHSPSYTVPEINNKKLIVTIHDLTFFLYPEWHTFLNRRFSINQCVKATRFADRIITDSFNTKEDIKKILHIEEEKIVVIPLAAREIYCPLDNKEKLKEKLKEKYDLKEEFILYVGALEPRKNVKTLIYAFDTLIKEYKEILLVVISGASWLEEDIYKLVEKLNLKDKIKFLKLIPEEELPIFYNLAKIFVYPSLYEGFGFPVLEALSCGTPVITSNTSSLPEVVGNAAIMVNPLDTKVLAEKMYEVLTNRELQLKLKKAGIKRAKEFSWEKTAKETLKIYEEVFEEKNLY